MKRRIHWKAIIIIASVIVLVFLVMDLNQRLDTKNRFTNQLATVRVEGTQVMLTQDALRTAVAYASSEPAVVEYAYGVDMKQDEDEMLIEVVPGATAVETPSPISGEPVVAGIKNWQVWLELFFGD